MKAKLGYYLHWLREGAMRVVRSYPVETLLALYACVGCLLVYELELKHLLVKLTLVPLFFALALAVNNLAGRGPWRKVYWVCWIPLIPLSFWTGLEAWRESAPYVISLGILAPLALLVSLRAVQNVRFVDDAIIWLRSGALALLFVNVALGLFYAILYSTTYIFGLEGKWIEHVAIYAVTISETLAVPILFLMMTDRWRGAKCVGNRIVDVLLNYIVTPALLIYTGILYLYMAKILVLWSLPEGGVAYMVFGFTLMALLVKALQQLLIKRIYDWFYDRFSLVSLPMLVLFWIGVSRRVGEYGLTEPRIYLLVCGFLMTLCVVLFLFRCLGRYIWVCLAALVSFGVLAYVPALEPERVAVRSQLHRALRIASSLDRLDAEGRLILIPIQLADTVYKKEYRNLYESLDYIQRDSVIFARFGVKFDEIMDIFPERMRRYVKWGVDYGGVDNWNIDLDLPHNASFEIVLGYSRLYTNLVLGGDRSYEFKNDTLSLWLGEANPVLVIPGEELLRQQLEKSGFCPEETVVPTPEQRMQLLDYRTERCRILFDNIRLERRDSTLVLSRLFINSIWMQ